MIGRKYRDRRRKRDVTVLVRGSWKKGQVRNVAVVADDGEIYVRPFRGLRRIKNE